jgi:hypothetical protein
VKIFLLHNKNGGFKIFMMDHDLQNVSDADYRRLITEAYPSPKRDIHAAVMAQVTAEAAQSGKKANILTPAFRNRFVKYGSIAACFVLLVTLGFRVLPMMTKDAVMESEAAAGIMMIADNTAACDDAETVPETAAAEENAKKSGAPVLFKAVLTDGTAAYSEESVTEEAPAEEAEMDVEEEIVEEPAPMLMMAPAPAAEEAVVEECVVEEAILEEAAAESAVSPVPPFEAELKQLLTEEIPAETYTAWMTGHGYTSPENWNITEFVQNFGISRERFTELYDALTAFFEQTSPDAEIISYNLDELYRQ